MEKEEIIGVVVVFPTKTEMQRKNLIEIVEKSNISNLLFINSEGEIEK